MHDELTTKILMSLYSNKNNINEIKVCNKISIYTRDRWRNVVQILSGFVIILLWWKSQKYIEHAIFGVKLKKTIILNISLNGCYKLNNNIELPAIYKNKTCMIKLLLFWYFALVHMTATTELFIRNI